MRAIVTIASILVWGLLFGPGGGVNDALAAASGAVTGTVTDAATGEALPGASVVVKGTSIGAATDENGRYTISGAPSGPQTLVVTYIGYQSVERDVVVPDGGTVEADFELSWMSIEGEEVVITAQVAGQLSAVNEQFRSATVSNVVSADRIQELPDNNAAESIGRLPGISIQRSGGEANRIAIRGLSPKYNTVTVNGVRLPSTDGDERSVDLSLVSSNILDGIEVRKAITPDMDADAIGGSVDLRLRNAPTGPHIDLLAQGGYTGLQQYLGNYKLVGTGSNRFFNDRLGAIATFNVEEYDRSADKLNLNWAGGAFPSTDSAAIRIDNINAREENVTRGRAGGSLLLDYTLSSGRITGNAFYNTLTNDALIRRQTGSLSSLSYITEDTHRETSILTSALGVEQDFGWLRYDATASYTRSRAESPEDYIFTFTDDGTAFTVGQDSLFMIPALEVGSRVRVDSSITLSSMYVDDSRLDENQAGLQLNVQMPFRFGQQITGYIKTGGKLRWLDRTFDNNRNGRGNIQYPNPDLFECLAQSVPRWADVLREGSFPITEVLLDYDRNGEFLDGDFGLGLVPDNDLMMELLEGLRSEACQDPSGDVYAGEYFPDQLDTIGRDYEGTERYQAGYVMGRFDIGRKLTVIPGVRYERDFSRYHGQRFREMSGAATGSPPVGLEELTTERENAYFLPMIHVDIRPTYWMSLRLARTETLTRPGYNQYAPITSVDIFNFEIRAANALLRPSRATNYDASFQLVQDKLGLIGVTAFRKTIDDLVFQVLLPTDAQIPVPEGTNIPEEWYVPRNVSPRLNTFINNDEPTTYYGFEFEWQTNFSYLPGALKGLVLNLNYTRSFSETTYHYYLSQREILPGRPPREVVTLIDSTRTGRMPDQAAHIANLTLGYDYRGFSARLSYLLQSNTASYINPQNLLLDNYVGDYARLDLSVSQRLGNGLQVFANFNNLNNRPDQTFTGQNSVADSYAFNTNALQYRELYGFTLDVGARYRF